MKNILLTLLVLSLFASCSIQKRHYTSGYFVQKSWKKPSSNRVVSASNNRKSGLQVSKNETEIPTVSHSQSNNDLFASAALGSVAYEPSLLNKPKLIGEEECDFIILKNGDEISAKVQEITEDGIKYKKCENPNGPTYTISKERVFMIKYSNGSKDIINPAGSENASPSQQSAPLHQASDNRKVQGLSLAGFIISLVLGWTLIGSLLGIIFGITGNSKIDKEPEKYKGKGFGTAAVIIGILGLVFSLLVIIALL